MIGKNFSAVVNNIPVIVTDVPSFESPSNFENLLHDPKIVFRGQAGIEKTIDAKSIKNLQVYFLTLVYIGNDFIIAN